MCTVPNSVQSARTNIIDTQSKTGYLLYNLLEFYPSESIRKVLTKTLLLAMQSDRFDEIKATERNEIAYVLQSLNEVFEAADDAVYSNL